MCRPGLCSAASELGCVTVSSTSSGSVVTAIVHPMAPPPPPKIPSPDDATQLPSSCVVDAATPSYLTDGTPEHVVGVCLYTALSLNISKPERWYRS